MISKPYNVVLRPNDRLTAQALRASKNLEKFDTLFTINGSTFYPHVSLYMLQLQTDTLPKVRSALADIAAHASRLVLSAQKYHQAKGYLYVEYEKPQRLSQLQDAVVAALNPLRHGLRKNDEARMKEAAGSALENFKKYGWNAVGELYKPHLTLTRFAQEEQTYPTNVLPSTSELSGSFSTLGLFEMGDNGTCVRKVDEFELGKL